jgi:exosortase
MACWPQLEPILNPARCQIPPIRQSAMEHEVTSDEGGIAAHPVSRARFGFRIGGGMNVGVETIPAIVTAVLFVGLFGSVFVDLAKDWWQLPEAGHGLLLAPVAIWMAWTRGLRADAQPNHVLGLTAIVLAVLIRCAAGLAAEFFSVRASMVMALGGLTIYHYGFRQVLHWWLPFTLACLAIPLPEIVTQALALPLQFRASKMGAALLHLRHVPVLLTGNVIRLPGHELFVTEACSGLRSLTALLSVGVLMGAMLLRTAVGRIALIMLAIPIAIVVNGIRVFMTGFLVYFVSPEFGNGFMHLTEGWLLFIVSLSILGAFAWVETLIERRFINRRRDGEAQNV